MLSFSSKMTILLLLIIINIFQFGVLMRKLFLLSLSISIYLTASDYQESLHQGWGQYFQIEEKIFEEKTDLQHLVLFHSPIWGRVLALDGAIQTTEKDEFVYHEMLSHVPILAHGDVKSVLVVGGGDGGIIREVLRHQNIEKVTLVEIDPSVIAFSKDYLPMISKGSFEDPRLKVVIEDGLKFVKQTSEKYDIILCDSTDPVGPASVLFTSEFYGDCKNILNLDGIFACQSGVPFLQKEEFKRTYNNLSHYFQDVGFYLAVVPTYVGGHMALGWATDNQKARDISIEELMQRMQKIEGEMKYYTPAIHQASFILPQFMQNYLFMR